MKTKILISKITLDIKNAIRDCLLNLFYKKSDLISFLNECGSTKNDMVDIEESLSKSKIIDIYYRNLDKRGDSGMMQYHSLIRNIFDWKDFESYWFDQKKLDANKAKASIDKLKNLLGRKTRVEEERLQAKEKEQKLEIIKLRNTTIENLRQEFYEMCKNKDSSQQRGYQFEKFLQKIFVLFEIDVFKPFKLTGEQIDGSIKFQGDNYIFEARWQDEAMANNALYNFAFKIESNTLYPRGLFFSINGYSNDAVERIMHGKNPKLLLLDATDFIAVLEERITISKLLEEKIRHAQTRGKIYTNANEILR